MTKDEQREAIARIEALLTAALTEAFADLETSVPYSVIAERVAAQTTDAILALQPGEWRGGAAAVLRDAVEWFRAARPQIGPGTLPTWVCDAEAALTALSPPKSEDGA